MNRQPLVRVQRILLILATFFLAGIAAPARAQFETRATFALPEGAYSTALGDFRNDGKLDLVVVDNVGFTVSLGNGDGTFQAPVSYSAPLAYSAAVGDFNNDGNLDIVAANLSPLTVSVYLGNGDGTFKPPINSDTTAGSYFVAVGDFNNDKKLDIAIIDPPYISVLLGNGNGRFQPPSDNDSFSGAKWLAVADFNNDRKLDVLATGSFGSSYDIGVLLGNGNGSLENSITTPVEYVPATVAAADLNGDGKIDAVLGYDLDGLAVFLGNGDGTFQTAVNYNTTGIGGGEVIVADLNLEGKLDVVLPSGVGVDVFWGDGNGALQQGQFFASGETGLPALGDLNGDGLPDLALSNDLYTATMLNTGVVSFSPNTAPLSFPVQLVGTSSPQKTVQLTNNGTTDLSIGPVTLSGPFRMSNKCSGSISTGANCSISVVFKPKTAGTFTGLITITDSASSKPQFVDLSGSATVVKLSSSGLNFGNQKVGTKSASKTVTATNQGPRSIMFSSLVVFGKDSKDYSETDDCTGHAIPPGTGCAAMVTFDPTATGTRTTNLYFNLPTGSIGPAPVSLAGVGTN